MLSVVIETKNSDAALARTLAGLVGAAVEGIVRDVLVIDRGSTDGTIEVAEAAGCSLLGSDLRDCLPNARGEWLLFLEPGSQLCEGWMEAVVSHAGNSRTPARFRALPRGGILRRLLCRRRGIALGLLISRSDAAKRVHDARTAEVLASKVRKRTLGASIIPAQR